MQMAMREYPPIMHSTQGLIPLKRGQVDHAGESVWTKRQKLQMKTAMLKSVQTSEE